LYLAKSDDPALFIKPVLDEGKKLGNEKNKSKKIGKQKK